MNPGAGLNAVAKWAVATTSSTAAQAITLTYENGSRRILTEDFIRFVSFRFVSLGLMPGAPS